MRERLIISSIYNRIAVVLNDDIRLFEKNG